MRVLIWKAEMACNCQLSDLRYPVSHDCFICSGFSTSHINNVTYYFWILFLESAIFNLQWFKVNQYNYS